MLSGHGAFTQALLEAFKNKVVPCQEAFSSKPSSANIGELGAQADPFLTFQELANFVKKRVSFISKKLKDEPQNPTERDEHPEEDIPIFWFDN